MSRLNIYLNTSNNFRVTVSNPASSGSDWGDTPLQPGTVISPGSTNYKVASMGDPGFLESDHWGWLYFNVEAVDGSVQPFPIQIFVADKQVAGEAYGFIGPYSSDSTGDNKMPNGCYGPQNQRTTDSDGLSFTLDDITNIVQVD